ncbi:MAG: hypothetical protein GPJ54_11210 [Candidatus Heimdallarchaeota archaeon]|nr:hypothetical protein [Candidatus Heimdallarchaeota archaeon]
MNESSICWDNIPIIRKTEGIIIDGYWSDGFNIIIYDKTSNRLVRWKDSTVRPTKRYKGVKDGGTVISLRDLMNEKNVDVTEFPAYDKIKGKMVDYQSARELSYFQTKGIVPGLWYEFDNFKITPIIEKNNEIRKKMMGEPEPIVDLCVENLPILQSPPPEIPRAAFDIEVKSPRDIFPQPDEANYGIHAIAIYDSYGKSFIYYVGFPPSKDQKDKVENNLGYLPEIYYFNDERKMLEAFYSKIVEYPLVLSYNGDNFDLPYLYNRSQQLNTKLLMKYGKKKSEKFRLNIPIYQGHFRGKSPEYHFRGSIHLDLYRFFKNNSVRLYAFKGKYNRYRLDDVATALLGSKKMEHDLWFDEMTRDQMIEYNVRDVELTLKLTTFSDNLTINLMFVLMRVGKFTLTFVNRESISKWILNWIAFEHKRNGYIMPDKKTIEKLKGGFLSDSADDKQYKGAIVLDPVAGTYWNVVVADFASLYPSIIKKFRLSYETMRCTHKECKLNRVPGLEHWVCTRRQGIMSSLVGYVRDIRVKWFKPLSNSDDEKIAEFANTIQQALKVFINASYGVFGNKNFAFFCPPLAESTTAYARDALLGAKRVAEDMGLDVLYGDTDSIFIHKPTEDQFENLKIWSVVTLGIELGIDYRFRFLVLSSRKKNYFGVTTKSKMIVKGLQVKKSNTAIFIKNTFKEVTEILVEVTNEEELELAKREMLSILHRNIIRLREGKIPAEELAKMVSLRNDFDEYETVTPAVQITIQKIKGKNLADIEKGSQFMVVSVRPFEVMVQTNKFKILQMGKRRECNVKLVEEVRISEVDVAKYLFALEKSFLPIFEAFDMEWSDVERPTLQLAEYFPEI